MRFFGVYPKRIPLIPGEYMADPKSVCEPPDEPNYYVY